MNQLEKLNNMGPLGAILGDVAGSRFEFHNRKSKEFTIFHWKSKFTDDTVLSLAIMDVFNKGLQDDPEQLVKLIQEWARSYPACGYGANFKKWIYLDEPKPYGSYGNGAAARISPVAWFANSEEELDKYVDAFTLITHDHEEGIKGARVVAKATYMAKNGASKEEIKAFVEQNYNINFDYEELVRSYEFDFASQNTVPQALYCFLISESLEDCLRTAVSIGGDTDTIAAIACSVGSAYYQDKDLLVQVKPYLEELYEVAEKFIETCKNHLA